MKLVMETKTVHDFLLCTGVYGNLTKLQFITWPLDSIPIGFHIKYSAF